ncbi:MAG: hypothetical protein WC962_09665 [Phycisphaerae bacterium]
MAWTTKETLQLLKDQEECITELETALADMTKRAKEAEQLIAAIKVELYDEEREIVFRYEGWECDYHDMAGEAVGFMKAVKRIVEPTTKEAQGE